MSRRPYTWAVLVGAPLGILATTYFFGLVMGAIGAIIFAPLWVLEALFGNRDES